MTETVTQDKQNKFKSYLKALPKRYFITAFSGMAQGLFCTLIAGTILSLVAGWLGDNHIAYLLNSIATIAKILMGAGIGIGIAYKLNAKPLVIFTAAVTGFIGAFALELVNGTFTAEYFSKIYSIGKPGNPIGSFVLSILTVEICSLYAGKTKLDIVLIPLGMLVISLIGVYVAWPFI